MRPRRSKTPTRGEPAKQTEEAERVALGTGAGSASTHGRCLSPLPACPFVCACVPCRSPLVLQTFVYGDSLRSQVRASKTRGLGHAAGPSSGPSAARGCDAPPPQPPPVQSACPPHHPPPPLTPAPLHPAQLVAVVVPDPEVRPGGQPRVALPAARTHAAPCLGAVARSGPSAAAAPSQTLQSCALRHPGSAASAQCAACPSACRRCCPGPRSAASRVAWRSCAPTRTWWRPWGAAWRSRRARRSCAASSRRGATADRTL